MNINDVVKVSVGDQTVKGTVSAINRDSVFIKVEGSNKLIKIIVLNSGTEPASYRIVQVDEDGRERLME